MKILKNFLGLFLFFMLSVSFIAAETKFTVNNNTVYPVEIKVGYAPEKYEQDSDMITKNSESKNREDLDKVDDVLKASPYEFVFNIAAGSKKKIAIAEGVLFFVVRAYVNGLAMELLVALDKIKDQRKYGVYLRDRRGAVLFKCDSTGGITLALKQERKKHDGPWVAPEEPENSTKDLNELDPQEAFYEQDLRERQRNAPPVERCLLGEFEAVATVGTSVCEAKKSGDIRDDDSGSGCCDLFFCKKRDGIGNDKKIN